MKYVLLATCANHLPLIDALIYTTFSQLINEQFDFYINDFKMLGLILNSFIHCMINGNRNTYSVVTTLFGDFYGDVYLNFNRWSPI